MRVPAVSCLIHPSLSAFICFYLRPIIPLAEVPPKHKKKKEWAEDEPLMACPGYP
jgi:hypothetical protein